MISDKMKYEYADAIRQQIANGEDPEQIKQGLWQSAIGWLQDSGAIYAADDAGKIVAEIWSLAGFLYE